MINYLLQLFVFGLLFILPQRYFTVRIRSLHVLFSTHYLGQDNMSSDIALCSYDAVSTLHAEPTHELLTASKTTKPRGFRAPISLLIGRVRVQSFVGDVSRSQSILPSWRLFRLNPSLTCRSCLFSSSCCYVCHPGEVKRKRR